MKKTQLKYVRKIHKVTYKINNITWLNILFQTDLFQMVYFFTRKCVYFLLLNILNNFDYIGTQLNVPFLIKFQLIKAFNHMEALLFLAESPWNLYT